MEGKINKLNVHHGRHRTQWNASYLWVHSFIVRVFVICNWQVHCHWIGFCFEENIRKTVEGTETWVIAYHVTINWIKINGIPYILRWRCWVIKYNKNALSAIHNLFLFITILFTFTLNWWPLYWKWMGEILWMKSPFNDDDSSLFIFIHIFFS